MKLLLDEMFPSAIAESLRNAGHDVVAVQEDDSLRELDDAALFGAAQRLSRALVTENVKDFVPLDALVRASGESHHGLVFTTNRGFPRHRRGFVGVLVNALRRLLDQNRADDAASAIHWL